MTVYRSRNIHSTDSALGNITNKCKETLR